MAEETGAEDLGTEGGTTFTQADLDNAVQEALVKAKENDTAFTKVWEEGKKAKSALREFEGLDPKEARAALAKLKEMEQEGKAGEVGVTSEQLRQIRDDVRQGLEEEYMPYKTKAEGLESKLRELQLDNRVKSIMAKQGVRPERIEALFRLNAEKFDLTDEGEPMLKDNPGKDVGKFVGDVLGEEFPEFFLSSGSSGGGASKSSAGGTGRVRTISQRDKAAMEGVSLEDIASGKVIVNP